MFKTLSGRLSATFNLDGNHLDRYLARKKQIVTSLCEDVILHDQILVPTQDYLTACGLILTLGESNFISLLEAGKIQFLRTRGVFGYVRGTGRDGSLIVFSDPDGHRPQDSEIDASVDAGLSVIANTLRDRRKIADLLCQHSVSLELANLVDSTRRDSYADLKQTTLWRNGYLYPHRDLLALPYMKKMQVRVIGPGIDIEKNPVDLLLALALYNVEMRLAMMNDCVSSSTASPLGDSIALKIQRITEQKVSTENFWSLLEINRVPDFSELDVSEAGFFDELIRRHRAVTRTPFVSGFTKTVNLIRKKFWRIIWTY